jgi:hypothetical protein
LSHTHATLARIAPRPVFATRHAASECRPGARPVSELSHACHTVARMDILMVSDVYFPRINGVSTSIRTFAKALVALGHRVVLVAPDYGAGACAMSRSHAMRSSGRCSK